MIRVVFFLVVSFALPLSLYAAPPTVQPGVGIPGVCEVGMTVMQITNAMSGVTVHSVKGVNYSSAGFIIMPSVGGIGLSSSGEGKSHIENISYYTQIYKHGAIPGVEISEPFRGTVAGLSFEHGYVSREDVENRFGVISNYAASLQAIVPFSRVAQPYWWNTPWGEIQLVYPNKGITFNMCSNKIISFKIYPIITFGALRASPQNRN